MTTTPRSQIISISDLGWQDFQPGLRFKILWEDKPTKRRAQLTRLEPGAKLPLHRHVGDELIFVLEGAVSDESGAVTAGNVGYRPNGCVHTVSRKNGATVLAVLNGDIEPASDRGERAALADLHAQRPAVDRDAPRSPPEAVLGGQGRRAPGAAGALRAGGHAPAPSSRRRRADLPRRGRERGR